MIQSFAPRLLDWQQTHGRHHLPWQLSRDPYHIWLSEIMLQQTRVDTVIPYFERFIARLPGLPQLAAASADEVLSLWSGLGYYARARNLHRTARIVVDHHDGELPRSAAVLATLPGIGRSTAAAIAAFAFGERGAILDGNVRRVLCRLFAIEGDPSRRSIEQQLWTLAEALLPEHEVGRYIQAQMDLGATLCTRHRPACERCPFAGECRAHLQQRTDSLPSPRRRSRNAPRRSCYAVIRHGNAVLLERRPPAGIWGGLLCLPEIPLDSGAATWVQQQFDCECTQARPLPSYQHAFTHFTLELQPMLLEIRDRPPARAADGEQWHWLDLAALDSAALPAAVRHILAALESASVS